MNRESKIKIGVGIFSLVCSALLLLTIFTTGILQEEYIVLHTVTTGLINSTSADVNLSPYITLFWPLIFFIAGLVFVLYGLNHTIAAKMSVGFLAIFMGIAFISLKISFPIIIIPILFILAGVSIIIKIFKTH